MVHNSQVFGCLFDSGYFGYAEGARAALSLAGTMLGYYPVRVLPSKTAIAPVNPTFLPRVRNFAIMIVFIFQNLKIGVLVKFLS